MTKYSVSLFVLILLFVFIIWMIPTSSTKNNPNILLEEKPEAQIQKAIKYRIEVSNPTNSLSENSSVLVAIPADLSRHTINNISISAPYKKMVDKIGNASVAIDIEPMAPYATKFIDITVNLNIFTAAVEQVNNIDFYTKAEKYIESASPKIIQQAVFLKADSELETAKKAYVWLIAYLSDSGFIAEDRGALYALKHKTADCTGYMYLYGALLRANGIPARMMSGFVVASNKKLRIKDYHNWVEIYLDGIWRVVDPQNNKFLEDESHYIAMRIIHHSEPNLFENSQQLFKTTNQLKISME